MNDDINSVPISEKAVDWLLGGLTSCYPNFVYPERDLKNLGFQNTYGPYKRTQFLSMVFSVTDKYDGILAANTIKDWKKIFESGRYPNATVPENLNDLVDALGDPNSTEGQKQVLANQAYLQVLSQRDSKLKTETLASSVEAQHDSKNLAPSSYSILEIVHPDPKGMGQLLNFVVGAPLKSIFQSGSNTLNTSSPLGATTLWAIANGVTSESLLKAVARANANGLNIDSGKIQKLSDSIDAQGNTLISKLFRRLYKPELNFLGSSQNFADIEKYLSDPTMFGNRFVLLNSPQYNSYILHDSYYQSGSGGILSGLASVFLHLPFGNLFKTPSLVTPFNIAKEVGKAALGTSAGSAIAGGLAISTGPLGWITSATLTISNFLKNTGSSLGRFITGEKNKGLRWLIYGGLIYGGISLMASTASFGLAKLIGATMVGTGGVGGLGEASTMLKSAPRAVGSFTGSLKTGLVNIALPSIAVPFGVAIIVVPLLIAIIYYIITTGAYVVPPPSVTATESDNPYISVTKTASPPGPFENISLSGDGFEVEYTIKITAKKSALSNIRFSESCSGISRTASHTCPNPDPSIPSGISESIPAGSSYELKYTRQYSNSNFADSLFTDTFTVTADSAEAVGVSDSGSASICIGDCPQECPSIWPVDGSGIRVTQTADIGTHVGSEAMDFAVIVGHSVRVTHGGVVRAVWYGYNDGYGNMVKIESSCNGNTFQSWYTHLNTIAVNENEQVTMGQEIGTSGDNGNSTGPHLHYEFKRPNLTRCGPPPNNPPFLMRPYVPRDVPRSCSAYACMYIP